MKPQAGQMCVRLAAADVKDHKLAMFESGFEPQERRRNKVRYTVGKEYQSKDLRYSTKLVNIWLLYFSLFPLCSSRNKICL